MHRQYTGVVEYCIGEYNDANQWHSMRYHVTAESEPEARKLIGYKATAELKGVRPYVTTVWETPHAQA